MHESFRLVLETNYRDWKTALCKDKCVQLWISEGVACPMHTNLTCTYFWEGCGARWEEPEL